MNITTHASKALVLAFILVGCGEPDITDPPRVFSCQYQAGADFLNEIGCADDFTALASAPVDATIPGARSVKTVVDRVDNNALYFQDSNKFGIHYEFVSTNLSGNGLPIVPMLASFNTSEYYAPSRRFLLGAVTHYEGPNVYAYELSPYDSASAEMIQTAYDLLVAHLYFGEALYFHPTSSAVAIEAERLPAHVRVITTAQLFADIDYQPLNVAESYGRLRFVTAEELETIYVGFRDIVVLEAIPNDISVVSGIISGQFQTPLSHINVLSKNRGTPNMALRGAFENEALRVLDGEWVRLTVGALDYTIEAVSVEEADTWWDANKPAAVQVPGVDLDITALTDIEDTIDLENNSLFDAIKAGTRAFGGKAAHYGALARIEDVPSPKAFAIPVFYYFQFLEQNGFDVEIDTMLADETFQTDPAVRDQRLETLRDAMKLAPVDATFEAALLAKLEADYPGIRMRFRSSTNAEDLDGFTGAGLYTSKSGEPADPTSPVLDAIRTVWASVWFFRAFEERSYRSIDHRAVGMALLVHNSFPDEEANGVALTNNPFDPSGLDPAFYVNVQRGETSVVSPPAGVTTDEFLYFFDRADQPTTFINHSNLVAPGEPVLTAAQTFRLGEALDRIRTYFAVAYGNAGWWAMDVEFKFDGEPGEDPALFVKQARPYR